MKRKIIFFVFISMFIYTSCDLNEPDKEEYSQSMDENGITFLVKDQTASSEGKFKIINDSNRVIYIPYLHYEYCSFILYQLEQKNNDEWINLFYDAEQNKWITPIGQDSIISICEEYKIPLEIKPNQSFEQKILGTEKSGEFRLNISYRYSENYNPDIPDKEIKILYLVN